MRVRKRRVEACYRIAPPHGILRDAKHTWRFKRADFYQGWRVVVSSSTLTLHKNHRLLREQTVSLSATELHFGGVRWWFICPDCQCRTAYLYLPQNAHHFSCRNCHNLSYESTQSSHSTSERQLQNWARENGTTTREARLLSYLIDSDGAMLETKRPRLSKVRRRRSQAGRVIAKLAREKGISL